MEAPKTTMESVRRIFRVDRRDINYLRSTIESYDGMAVVRTVDPHAADIELMIAPGCEELICGLVEHLASSEGLKLVNRPDGFGLSEPVYPRTQVTKPAR